MKMERIFGDLFEFQSKKDFDDFIENIDKQTATKIIEIALTYAQKNGLYDLKESYCIYKCLLAISKEKDVPK